MSASILRCAFGALTLSSIASAQMPAFTTPGMPPMRFRTGQTDRFSSEFNPAIGFVMDATGGYTTVDGGSDEEDGWDLDLRILEMTANAWVDPSVWAYAVVVYEEEGVELEEAVAQYVGWDSNATLRVGRFFVDFGKQMQTHIHDLAYPDRPAVLSEYLGDELAGTGLQFDNWFPVGEDVAVRYSIGVFDSLIAGHTHGEEEEEEEGAELFDKDRKDVDELGFTARITGFSDVGDNGILQIGASARLLPDIGFEDDELGVEADDLDNTIYGVDVTYGWTDETAAQSFTLSGEYLVFDGDINAEGIDPNGTPGDGDETIDVLNGDVSGFYAWADYNWDRFNGAGVLYSQFEHPEEDAPEDSQVTVYYTRNLTEFSRLRFAVSFLDSDEGDDETAFLVQFTNFLGPHSHGVNW